MELDAYKNTMNELIKSASAGKITEVVDICANLSNDYTTVNASLTNITQSMETVKTENEMLVKANSKLFLQQGSTTPTVPVVTKPTEGAGADNETIVPVDVKATLFDEKGGLK